jgi:lipopolysaccharide transport system ATP-binding protein
MSSKPSDEIAIKVTGVSKIYQVYEQPIDRLKQGIAPKLRQLLGLPKKDYCRNFVSLDNIDFSISKGETVGIIGRNGAGKSTLLQIICGTLQPTAGRVEVNGKVAALLELGAGFNPEFTGRENVYMNASILGLTEEQIDDRYESIAAFADIGEYLGQPVKTYSSGMYVRLAFAVITHVDADILVIDEALAVGDAFFTQKCMRFLRDFMQTGTVLFVSHDIASVTSLCSSALLLKQGRVEMDSSAKQVAEHYLEELYREHQDVDEVKVLDDSDVSITKNVDVQNVEFGSGGSFGTGGAQIKNVQFLNQENSDITWVSGAISVKLIVNVVVFSDIENLIVGFIVRDKLGQELLGHNTTKKGLASKEALNAGDKFDCSFKFVLPALPRGDYTITLAIADGDAWDNVQHHWVHAAKIFTSVPEEPVYGMVGLSLPEIKIDRF